MNSQLFDHTSVIEFIERRFADEHPGLVETNITPWRRAVTGDLSSAFDFSTPNTECPALPDVSRWMPVDKVKKPDLALVVPTTQALPAQEPGVRRSRALPYELHADAEVDTSRGSLRVVMINTGDATAVFQARSVNPADLPRCYTVEPGKCLAGVWNAATAPQGLYDLEVHGANDFLRAFRGAATGAGRANLWIELRYRPQKLGLVLTVRDLTPRPLQLRLADQYGDETQTQVLGPHHGRQHTWILFRQGAWYDLILTVAEDADFRWQAAGRIENGRHGISDPALGRQQD